MATRLRIGEVLIEEGYINQAQLEQALAAQKEYQGQKVLGQVLIELGFLNEEQMLEGLSKKLGLEVVNLSSIDIKQSAVEKIPKNMATKYNLIAVSEEDGAVVVAVNDPLNFYAIEDVKLLLYKPIKLKIAKLEDIQRTIRYWYGEIEAVKTAKVANATVSNRTDIRIENLEDVSGDAPVVSLINSVLFKAYNSNASDVHFEPFEDKTIVRIRVDGQMVNFLELAQSLHNSIVTRIKILSSLNIAERRTPQDGHFRAKLQGLELNVRISVLPTVFGEKVVLRFLNDNTPIDNGNMYGMDKADYDKLARMLESPYGMIYLTGPTGSGKTTTMYMILEDIVKRSINISTIEDPVERHLSRINQTQTNNAAGLTFESGLRSILRQDPDCIMIGETRDGETASIAVRSAITGHLVLSTLHTNDSVSAIVRLRDMGVEEYMIANSLVGVVAQRLVKKICPACKTAYQATERERLLLQGAIDDGALLYRGAGCPECSGTGYRGRRAVHEVLEIDKTIRGMINASAPMENIYDYVEHEQHQVSLRKNLVNLVISGVTTTEELRRLTFFVD